MGRSTALAPRALVLVFLAVFSVAGTAAGQQAPPPAQEDTIQIHSLAPLVVDGRSDDLTGLARTASQGFIGFRDLRLRPLVREGELLETVPGMIMTQHSGDGKSNQMFVRGFNLDHGTDFSTRVEGMQVNLPTHAHGQGYTDLNFIIPEFVDYIEYELGTYYADVGDFGAAGGAHLRFVRSLPTPFASVSVGENGFQRVVAGGSNAVGPGTLLGGMEYRGYDGPWDIPQELEKISGIARYSWQSGAGTFSVLGLGYRNEWNASDQIPSRLIESGAVNRFAQVDSTLGGETSRISLSGSWLREGQASAQLLELHSILYDLELYSNFTYRLDFPIEGDQIRQEDNGRRILGANFTHIQGMGRHDLTAGAQLRADFFNIALRRTEARETFGTVRADEGHQWSLGGYLEAETEWSSRVRTVLGLRADHYSFDVTSDLAANSGTSSGRIVSPKASLILTPVAGSEVYLSAGYGFHSNDARGTVQRIDPATGDEVDPVDPLVRARGAEMGLRMTPTEGWRSTLSLWTVDLDSELLFVGDAGTTEPSDPSRRFGATWTNFYRVIPGLAVDFDLSLARARLLEVGEEDMIPGAPEIVAAAGVTWEPVANGPFAALRFRRFGSYPLIENDSQRAPATSLLNLNVGWSRGGVRVAASILNLLDGEGADIQYLYGSRLSGEPGEGIQDLHLHPVEPRQLRVTLSWGL